MRFLGPLVDGGQGKARKKSSKGDETGLVQGHFQRGRLCAIECIVTATACDLQSSITSELTLIKNGLMLMYLNLIHCSLLYE